ncbi:MAG TPA: sigma-70 family RNA polymerase sigma factor [bacterium]|nr:sigma-70 family RNA polymerase sigma factor [bacterium]
MPSRSRAAGRTPESPPDAELVARCAVGDEAAWRILVTRYERLVYTVPYRMGLDPADADEVFQITFTRLAERINDLREPDRVRAWLVTTARRMALNLAGRRREIPTDVAPNLTDPAELPPEELARLQDQQLVRVALSRLGDRCRRLLTLLYYSEGTAAERSYKEVAAEMGIPMGSIGPTRMRCLKKLLAEFRRLTEGEERK